MVNAHYWLQFDKRGQKHYYYKNSYGEVHKTTQEAYLKAVKRRSRQKRNKSKDISHWVEGTWFADDEPILFNFFSHDEDGEQINVSADIWFDGNSEPIIKQIFNVVNRRISDNVEHTTITKHEYLTINKNVVNSEIQVTSALKQFTIPMNTRKPTMCISAAQEASDDTKIGIWTKNIDNSGFGGSTYKACFNGNCEFALTIMDFETTMYRNSCDIYKKFSKFMPPMINTWKCGERSYFLFGAKNIKLATSDDINDKKDAMLKKFDQLLTFALDRKIMLIAPPEGKTQAFTIEDFLIRPNSG